MEFSNKAPECSNKLFLPPGSLRVRNRTYDPQLPLYQPPRLVSLRGGGNTDSQPKPAKSSLCEVTCVGTSEQSRYMVCGFADGSLRMIDIHTQEIVLKVEEGHRSEICALAYSHDGEYVISASVDGVLRVLELKGKGKHWMIRNRWMSPETITLTKDNNYIIGGFRGQVRLFGLRNGKYIKSLNTDFIKTESVHKIAATSNNCFAVAVFALPDINGINQAGCSIRLWCLTSGKHIKTFQSTGKNQWKTATFTKKDNFLLLGGSHSIGYWNTRSGQMVFQVPTSNSLVSLQPTMDCKYLVCLYARNILMIYDFKTMECEYRFDEKGYDDFYDMSLADSSQYIILKGLLGAIKMSRFPHLAQRVS